MFPWPHPRLHPAGQALDTQKAFGVGLVVRAAALHRGDAFVVEATTGARGSEIAAQFFLGVDAPGRLGPMFRAFAESLASSHGWPRSTYTQWTSQPSSISQPRMTEVSSPPNKQERRMAWVGPWGKFDC